MAEKVKAKQGKQQKKRHYIDFFCDMSHETRQMLTSAIKEAEDNEFDEVVVSLSPGKKPRVKFPTSTSLETIQMLISVAKEEAQRKQSNEITISLSTKKGDDPFAEKDSVGEEEPKEDEEIVTLCANCANLEIWQSKPHNVRQEACSVRNLLVPRETECSSYRLLGEKSTGYLCRSCKHLETWTSPGKEIVSEVCSLRHIILPSKQVCEQYSPRAKNNG